jgi:hypothetical protein
MIVYKTVDLYSPRTGEKAGTKKEFDFQICDFTGDKISEFENPYLYIVNYNNNDPCFGDGPGERWFYKYRIQVNNEEDYTESLDPWYLFGQSDYVFKEKKDKDRRCEVFGDLINAAKHLKLEIYSLSHLLRWSRARMLEKVITSGKYTLNQFSSE